MQRVERARRLAFAAFGPAGLCRRRPGIDVEVQPGLGGGDEALEEQRADDRAGKAAGRDVVEIGHLGIEHGVVGPPQRQAPQRIVLGAGMAGEIGGERFVVGVERRQLGPERDPRRAGERSHVDEKIGALLVGERERVGEDEAALGVGVADLDGEAVACAVDIERPERAAGDRILDRRNEHAQPHRQLPVHDHVGEREHGRGAAHVLLHQQHRAFGLDVEAAGVEAHALADQRHLRCRRIAPSEVDQAGLPGGGAADRMNERKIVGEEIVADDHARARAVAAGERRGRIGDLAGPHVVRRRVDEVAREIDGLGGARELGAVDAVGNFDAHLVRRLAVADEAVGAERNRERGKARVMGRVGEAIGAARQHAGERAGQEGIDRLALLPPVRTARRRGCRRARAGTHGAPATARSRGHGEGAGARIEARADVAPGRSGHEPDRNGRGGAAGHEGRMHREAFRGFRPATTPFPRVEGSWAAGDASTASVHVVVPELTDR